MRSLQCWYYKNSISMLNRVISFSITKALPKTVLYQTDSHEYQLLRPHHTEATIKFVTQTFFNANPVLVGYAKTRPHMAQELRRGLDIFGARYIEDCTTNNLSIVTIDKKTDEILGVGLLKDYSVFKPLSPLEQQNDLLRNYAVLDKVLWDQVDHPVKACRTIKGKIFYMMAIGIDKKLRGFGSGSTFMRLIDQQAKKNNFQYFYSICENRRTHALCQKFGCDTLAETNIQELELDGVKAFAKTEDSQKDVALVVKKYY